jgi:small subunit ribosomal protein S18
MSDRGKIRSRRVTGNCAQHQRALAQAIKTARELVLLPYTQRTVTERPGGRRDRGDRGDRTLSDGFAERGDRDRSSSEVQVNVLDDTEAVDAEAEAGEVAEVEELVEEMAEDAAADDLAGDDQ